MPDACAGQTLENVQAHGVFDEPLGLSADSELEAALEADGPDDAGKVFHEGHTLFICDEIQCGYGRSGRFFAHQHLGIKPDLITVGKGIANGFPMGALLISPRFEAVHGQLGTTFGGNHLACAGALAVLDVIEREKLIENAAAVGQYVPGLIRWMPFWQTDF